jgi:hypothetical protein
MEELNPAQRLQLDALGEEYYLRYGTAVELIKAQVGKGEEFGNAVAKAVISSNGAWCQCVDLPMEFTGLAGGPVEHRFVSDETALRLLDRLNEYAARVNPLTTRHFSLLVLYARTGIVDGRNAYVFHHRSASGMTRRPLQIGTYRPGEMPLFFRCRLDDDSAHADIPLRRGVIFCLAGIGERNLLAVMPYEGEELHDLSEGSPGFKPQ